MKTKHTPEPWFSGDNAIAGSDGATVAYIGSEADGARIVSCVNALKDIEDPEAFVKAARRVLGEMAYLRATNDIRDSVNNYSDAELEADGRALGVPNLFDADGVE